jgi:predicted cupin superfamily sugar epimerase
MTPQRASRLIAALDLKPLPVEGGYYRETYRSPHTLPPAALPPGYSSARSVSTAIYYLLTPDTCSAMHRLPADEVFHFYLGDPVEMLQLDPDRKTGRTVTLGSDLFSRHQPQVVVPAGCWQGSLLVPGGSCALLGTTMAPGFDLADYQGGDREHLCADFPEFAEQISRRCPPHA